MKIYYKVITAYIILSLSILLAIFLTTIIKNPITLALLFSIIPLGDYFLYSWVTKDKLLISEDKTSVRYTMHCKNCGWEWMSNTSDKIPSLCPNCRTKDKAEIIGWRKVNLSTQKQKEKDLRNFFKFT
jgi:predicted Zn-ribbon and HTH transcriptional regulator